MLQVCDSILQEFYLRPMHELLHAPSWVSMVMDPTVRAEEDERRLLMSIHWPPA